MSVDVTKLPSGLTVITDTMPHLETAALGVWTGVGGRDEKPNEHGISHLLEHLNELCYPDQPMGRSLLGTAKTLKGFNRDTLRGYLTTHYRGPDMVVAAAGAIDHKRIVEDVQHKFASFDGTPAPKPQPAMFGKGGSRVVHRDLEQAHLTLALEGLPQSDLSLFSLQVFTNILGGGMSP